MKVAPNPYVWDRVSTDLFYGRARKDLATELLGELINGRSFAIVGGRRMGKSVLLNKVMQDMVSNSEEWRRGGLVVVPVYIDGHGLPFDGSPLDIFLRIADSVDSYVRSRSLLSKEVHKAKETSGATDYLSSFSERLTTVAQSMDCRLQVVILFDEIAPILNHEHGLGFFWNWRTVLSNSPLSSFASAVFAGATEMRTIAEEHGWSPLGNIVAWKELGLLSLDDTNDLVNEPTRQQLTSDFTSTVFELTGGHPFLIQYLMHQVCETDLEQAQDSLVRAQQRFLEEQKWTFDNWWRKLDAPARDTYRFLSHSVTPVQRRDIVARSGDDAYRALSSLCQVGVVRYHPSTDEYQSAGALFLEWQRRSSTMDAAQVITWLHLSDLHFRDMHAYEADVVVKALLEDIGERIRVDGLQPDFIILSGDIAYAGQREEYAMAAGFLDDLLKIASLPKDRLFPVPGNHDVDRDAISDLAAGAAEVLRDRGSVNRLLNNGQDRALVLERFHNYQHFIGDYFHDDHLRFDRTNYFYVDEIEVEGRLVAILGLNSAWLAGSDEDRQRLVLGERQVRAALDAVEDADLRLAVMHHPFDWLRDFDRSDVEPLLCGKCDFVLHGHLHQIGLLQAQTPDTNAMIIGAGTCYEKRDHSNSYNFVQLNLGTGHGKVYLRMYSDKRGGFWTKDVFNYRNLSDGVHSFILANWDG